MEEEFKTAEDIQKWLAEDRNVPASVTTAVASTLFEGGYLYPSSLLNILQEDLGSLNISPPHRNILFNKLQQQQQGEDEQQQHELLLHHQQQHSLSKPAFFTPGADAAWTSYASRNPRDAVKHTDFLQTITDADVKVHNIKFNAEDGTGAWPNTSSLEEKAIHIFKLDFPGHEEAMGDGMSMVKLPLEIPVGEAAAGSNASGMFLRNEDMGLIKAWNSKRVPVDSEEKFRVRAAVVGNPGISKSWHLWKYLVMAANTQLWKEIAGDEPFPNQPEVIAFVFGADIMNVYFLKDKIVHVVESDFKGALQALNEIANEEGNVRMLYEPSGSLQQIPHSNYMHFNIPCTGAVSPRTTRYKEFLKQPFNLNKHIMPCPTWPEIAAICSFIAYLKEDKETKRKESLALVKERFKDVGPFLRVLLSDDIDKYKEKTTAAIAEMSLETLNRALKTIESDDADVNATPPITHRVARYTTPNSASGDFETAKLLPSSEPVVRKIRSRLNELSTDRLRELLLNFENGISDTTENPKAYETLLSRYICEDGGLRWPYAHSQLTFDSRSPNPKRRSLERLEATCAKMEVSYESPLASEMKINVLYLPDDTSYPFVDMLWVEDDALVQDSGSASFRGRQVELTMRTIFAAQNSTSSSHEKYLTVYESLRKKLGMPSAQLLVIYMAVLPQHVEGYLNGPASTYFKGTTKRGRTGEPFQIPSNVEFRVLLPDKEMRNRPPKETDYHKALKKIYKEPKRSSPRTQCIK